MNSVGGIAKGEDWNCMIHSSPIRRGCVLVRCFVKRTGLLEVPLVRSVVPAGLRSSFVVGRFHLSPSLTLSSALLFPSTNFPPHCTFVFLSLLFSLVPFLHSSFQLPDDLSVDVAEVNP